MARIARIVIPDIPHHVTQRGNRRQTIFHTQDDYAVYCDLLAGRCRAQGVAVWAYCLMPNHVHLILVPRTAEGLSRAIGEVHRRYTGYLNARLRVTGQLFQGRFGSIAMDEPHLLAAARYMALNPVFAGLVERAQDWRWSSARAHLTGQDDALVTTRPLLERIDDFGVLLDTDPDPVATRAVVQAPGIGRPLMDEKRLRTLEHTLNRQILPRKRGPQPKSTLESEPNKLVN